MSAAAKLSSPTRIAIIGLALMDPTPQSTQEFHRLRDFLWGLAKESIGPKWDRRFDASDIVQETLLRAHRMRDQFRGSTDAEAAAWLKTILTRTIQNHMRDHSRECRDIEREVPIERSLERSSAVIEGLLLHEVATPSQRAIEVATWLIELPDEEREAVVNRQIWRLSMDAAAERMKTTPEEFARLLRSGLERLRERDREHQRNSSGR